MGKVRYITKWNLDENSWEKPTQENLGKSFAIIDYEDILNDNGKINYIIFNHGSRLENHSKDYNKVNSKEVRMNYLISHYRRLNGNYRIKLFLMDNDAPLIEQAKHLAYYIEKISLLPSTNSINLIGLSKGSVVNFYVPSFFRYKETYEKTNIFNIAAPYEGTKLASPLILYRELKSIIVSKMGDNNVSQLVYKSIIDIYENISSNSHMDYDISIQGGIPKEKLRLYDEKFIRNVFCSNNINAVKKLQTFRNIITGIDSNTLKEAMLTMNFSGIGLCILDDLFFENSSDGMVLVSSQRKIEDILDIKSDILLSSHHDVNSNKRVFKDILDIVDDTILEHKEKIKARC